MASTAMRPVLPADNTALPIDDFDPGEPPGTVATLSATPPVPIALSPTLAANELMAARKQRGEPVLPMAFGEAGLPGAPGPAAGAGRGHRPDRLRPGGRAGRLAGVRGRVLAAARAGHRPAAIVCGPGSKALLFGLMLAIGGDVAVPRPSWVSYAAQASLIGASRTSSTSGPARAAYPTPTASATRPGRPGPPGASCGRSSSRCRTTRPARWPARPRSGRCAGSRTSTT